MVVPKLGFFYLSATLGLTQCPEKGKIYDIFVIIDY